MKTKQITWLSMLLPVCFVLLITACSTPVEERSYGRWDEDRNATLDEREFGTAWGEEDYFRRWDANNDSYLDESEWNSTRSAQLGEYDGSFQDWDTDGDNQLSEDEFRIGVYSYFDKDGDRMINEEEYNAWSMPGKDKEPATEVQ